MHLKYDILNKQTKSIEFSRSYKFCWITQIQVIYQTQEVTALLSMRNNILFHKIFLKIESIRACGS